MSAQDALRTLADELRAQLRLGVAEAVHVFWDDKLSEWRVAVTEDDLRRAVTEVAFVHNVTVEPFDVQVNAAERFASWGECEKWKGLGGDQDGEDE